MGNKLHQDLVIYRMSLAHPSANYDYSEVVYVGMHTKVCIICPKHGEFWMTPNHHTVSKNGCPKCSGRVPVYPDLSHIQTPEGSKVVPVGIKGDYALVDEEDYDRVMQYNWSLTVDGYAYNYNIGRMHRFIMNPSHGRIIDHVNHNTLDNRRQNLRICTKRQNSLNTRPHVNGTSKYKGVSWDKRQQSWVARIMTDVVYKYLGYFDSEEEAARAYDEAAKKYHKEFACLNFPNTLSR